MTNFKELMALWENTLLNDNECLLILGGEVVPGVANNCECNSNNCSCQGRANNCNCSDKLSGNNCACGYATDSGIGGGGGSVGPGGQG